MHPNVAIIDSGVNPGHPHVMGVAGGLAFSLDPGQAVVSAADYRDLIGHGTAIAGVIRGKVPHAQLYALKIFHQSLDAPLAPLMAALEWAIQNHIKIIHLSLGTAKERARKDLDRLCKMAYARKIVIIAAARSATDRVYPAVFDSVIGVYWNRTCDENTISYHPQTSIHFGAYGWPRPLPGLPQTHNLRGSSFAAAHVTARVARWLTQHPGEGADGVKKMLARTARNATGDRELSSC